MGLMDRRVEYRPFEYPFAYEYGIKQHQNHWIHTDIQLSKDLVCWQTTMTAAERRVVTRILRLFTQRECLVGEYWSSNVAVWFPKPEIQIMASAFSGMEGIHIMGYSYLNDSLGLPETEYSAFMKEPSMLANIEKMEQHLHADAGDVRAIARSLAVFSAFVEGVCLFSSFAVLKSFELSGKLMAIGDLIDYSMRDESLHSQAGCELFRTLISEHSEIWTDDFKREIYQAARDIVALEEAFIDHVFEGISDTDIKHVTAENLKKYIRHRANVKLGDLGLKANWDAASVSEHGFGWMDVVGAGTSHSDFFSRRVTSYSKGVGEVSEDDMFDSK